MEDDAEAQPTRPSPTTRQAERAEAATEPKSGDPPTSEEEQAAERAEVDEAVSEHYEEMLERGAAQKGEGRIP